MDHHLKARLARQSKVLVSPGKSMSMEDLKEREKGKRKIRSQRKKAVLKKQHQKPSIVKMKPVKMKLMSLMLNPWEVL